MTHRVHTILSLLAEDHAPAALRSSILLAVDWPTVAEEAPATGDDSYIACVAAGILGGKGRHSDPPPASVAQMAILAARLATVAASITATGDKAMSHHAAALWGAAAALVGLPTTATTSTYDALAPLRTALPSFASDSADLTIDLAVRRITRAKEEHTALAAIADKAADIVPGAKPSNLAGRSTLIATALDRVYEHRNMAAALREQLLFALGLETSLRTTAQLIAEVIESREQARAERDAAMVRRNQVRDELHKAIGERDATRIERDRALTENRGARDILRVPAGGDLVAALVAYKEEGTILRQQMHRDAATLLRQRDAAREDIDTLAGQKATIATERDSLRASLTVMEAEVARLQARENAKDKPRPQPGDAVPWAEVEDRALYHRAGERCPFRMSIGGRVGAMFDADDRDVLRMVGGTFGAGGPDFENHTPERPLVLVARNLGSDPEAWRAAMRTWTANGNKPAPKDPR